MQQFFAFPAKSECSFDNFVVCDGNSAALRYARRMADMTDCENLLYLHGPAGSGKTHLLKSIALELAPATPSFHISCREFSAADDPPPRMNEYRALLVDDLHLLPAEPSYRNRLWQLFNEFHDTGRKVAMAGRYAPRELANLDEHLVSRLLWGLVVMVDASDDSSRRMILKKVADDRQIRVPDEVVDYIIVTAGREVNELISAFNTLYSLAMTGQRRITLPLAREARNTQMNSGIPS